MDQMAYADTMKSLDDLRKQVIADKSRNLYSAQGAVIRKGVKTVTKPEAQIARIQQAAMKDFAKLQTLHQGLRDRIVSGEELGDDELETQALEAVKLRHRLEYYKQIGTEIGGNEFWAGTGLGKSFDALANPKAAEELRKPIAEPGGL